MAPSTSAGKHRAYRARQSFVQGEDGGCRYGKILFGMLPGIFQAAGLPYRMGRHEVRATDFS